MIKTIKVTSGKIDKLKNVKVTEGDLSRIGAEKFRKVEFWKLNPAFETATHEFLKSDCTCINVGPEPKKYT